MSSLHLCVYITLQMFQHQEQGAQTKRYKFRKDLVYGMCMLIVQLRSRKEVAENERKECHGASRYLARHYSDSQHSMDRVSCVPKWKTEKLWVSALSATDMCAMNISQLCATIAIGIDACFWVSIVIAWWLLFLRCLTASIGKLFALSSR